MSDSRKPRPSGRGAVTHIEPKIRKLLRDLAEVVWSGDRFDVGDLEELLIEADVLVPIEVEDEKMRGHRGELALNLACVCLIG